MKNIILSQFLSILLLSFSIQSNTYSQTQGTVSANCGKCGKSVSPYAKVGDTCPHCGVRWGKENSTTTNINTNRETDGVINPFAVSPSSTISQSRFDYSQPSISSESNLSEPSTVIRSCKLRSASSSTSEVLLIIPKNSDILIQKRKGDWVKVFYINNLRPVYGWIHSSNVVE